jgi:hypothetical protein
MLKICPLYNFLFKPGRCYNFTSSREFSTQGEGDGNTVQRQPTVGLVVSKIKQNIFSAKTATF